MLSSHSHSSRTVSQPQCYLQNETGRKKSIPRKACDSPLPYQGNPRISGPCASALVVRVVMYAATTSSPSLSMNTLSIPLQLLGSYFSFSFRARTAPYVPDTRQPSEILWAGNDPNRNRALMRHSVNGTLFQRTA